MKFTGSSVYLCSFGLLEDGHQLLSQEAQTGSRDDMHFVEALMWWQLILWSAVVLRRGDNSTGNTRLDVF